MSYKKPARDCLLSLKENREGAEGRGAVRRLNNMMAVKNTVRWKDFPCWLLIKRKQCEMKSSLISFRK